MSKTITRSEGNFVEQSRVALTNVETQPSILSAMQPFGYTAEKLEQGKSLLQNAKNALSFNQQEDNETIAARADFDALRDELDQAYRMDRKKAKVAFRKDPQVLQMLGLIGAAPRAYVKWVEGLKKFYNTASGNDTIGQGLATMLISAEAINERMTKITALEAARAEYLREIGESQDATKQKDKAMAELDDWMRDFYAIAKIALEDQPQLLEALGKKVKS